MPRKPDDLRQLLDERLEGVPKPLAVKAIDKTPYLNNGDLKAPDKLVEEIERVFHQQPQIAVILNWEKRVSDATADTVFLNFQLGDDLSETQERGERMSADCLRDWQLRQSARITWSRIVFGQ